MHPLSVREYVYKRLENLTLIVSQRYTSEFLDTHSFRTIIMKLIPVITIIPLTTLFATAAYAQEVFFTTTAKMDLIYDDCTQTLDGPGAPACSNLAGKYKTIGDFPGYVCGFGGIEYGAPQCGACFQLTYTNPTTKVNSTIYVTAIDHVDRGFNIGSKAMKALGHDAYEQAYQSGGTNLTSTIVNYDKYCGKLPPGCRV